MCRVQLQLGPVLQGKLIAALRGPCDHTPTLLHPTSTQPTAHAKKVQSQRLCTAWMLCFDGNYIWAEIDKNRFCKAVKLEFQTQRCGQANRSLQD